MKVRFLTDAAGPKILFHTNEIVELPDEAAQQWIKSGAAVAVEDEPKRKRPARERAVRDQREIRGE